MKLPIASLFIGTGIVFSVGSLALLAVDRQETVTEQTVTSSTSTPQNGGALIPLQDLLILSTDENDTDNIANIVVTSPRPNDTIPNPVTITGRARVFENVFEFRISDQGGAVLASGFGTANAPDIGQFGNFNVTISYKTPTGTRGTVEVFESSAKDGSEINKVTLPVFFSK